MYSARWSGVHTTNAYCDEGHRIYRQVELEKANELVMAGAERRLIERPSELDEHHEGKIISYDDMIDFHQLLERVDWFDTLVGMTMKGVVLPGSDLERELHQELLARADYVDQPRQPHKVTGVEGASLAGSVLDFQAELRRRHRRAAEGTDDEEGPDGPRGDFKNV